jgi:hypothetical protein
LILAPKAGIAVCGHCGSHVALPVATADAAGNLNEDLAQVEQWWSRQRHPFMTRDRRGNLHPPEEQHIVHVVLMVLGGVLGLICAAAGHALDWDVAAIAGFFLFPILISLPAALLHQRAERRYKEYKTLEAEYQGRRNAIVDRHARRP